MNFVKYQRHDWFITILVFVLLVIGSIVIYSATYNTELVYQGAGSSQRQFLFILMGLGIYFGLNFFDIKWLKEPKVIAFLYLIIIAMLVYLVFFGENIAATRRWINFGFINIQPSEYAKLIIIVLSARIFSSTLEFFDTKLFLKNKTQDNSLKSKLLGLVESYPQLFLFAISIVISLPIIFLVFIQPAFGNSMILILLWSLIFFVSVPSQLKFGLFIVNIILTIVLVYGFVGVSERFGLDQMIFGGIDIIGIVALFGFYTFSIFQIKLDWKNVAIAALIGLTIVPIVSFGWNNILKDYQRARVESFVEGPEADRFGAGYQVTQSRIAIGSGQLLGRGFLEGSQSSLKVLDFAYTDFIFAAMAEQFGFVGSMFILVVYLFLLFRILIIASNTNDPFATLICVGVASMILLNIFINVGMNLGILPVTGVPLPLVSYGGNSIIVNLIGLGLVQAVYSQMHSKEISEKFLLE